jgi:hypothetical protein
LGTDVRPVAARLRRLQLIVEASFEQLAEAAGAQRRRTLRRRCRDGDRDPPRVATACPEPGSVKALTPLGGELGRMRRVAKPFSPDTSGGARFGARSFPARRATFRSAMKALFHRDLRPMMPLHSERSGRAMPGVDGGDAGGGGR